MKKAISSHYVPEIPTSIDPQQDPDYSAWGEETASVNYIGLITYLVKANTELHERAKAFESKLKSENRHVYILFFFFLKKS